MAAKYRVFFILGLVSMTSALIQAGWREELLALALAQHGRLGQNSPLVEL